MDKLKTQLDKLMESLKANITTSTYTTDEKYDCQICRDVEWLVVDDLAHPCQCRQAKTLQRMLKSSGLTDELRAKSFSNYKAANTSQEQAFKVCYEYVKDFASIKQDSSNGVGLTGPVGTGKTHLLAAISNSLFAGGIGVCFVCTPDLIAELREAQFEPNDALERKLTLACTAEVVVFDDLGKEKSSEWVQTQYYRVINHRYLHRLPTLFTTNHTMDELSGKVGDAAASRLYSMTKGRLVFVQGEDFRLKG